MIVIKSNAAVTNIGVIIINATYGILIRFRIVIPVTIVE